MCQPVCSRSPPRPPSRARAQTPGQHLRPPKRFRHSAPMTEVRVVLPARCIEFTPTKQLIRSSSLSPPRGSFGESVYLDLLTAWSAIGKLRVRFDNFRIARDPPNIAELEVRS